MKICVIGTGYVGLVTGTCFAEMGNDVICMDVDAQKVASLKQGKVPIYEPGLEEMVQRNLREQRLDFTTDLVEAVRESLLIFIAVGTPSDQDGTTDLNYVLSAARSVGRAMNGYKIIVNKSTVPVGTADKVRDVISSLTRFRFDVVSNPEFLKEGAAVEDFMKPDRVVIGTEDVRVAEILKELYAPFTRTGNPILVMDMRSAEMTKYAANAMLACRISFINEIANLCEHVGADVHWVRQGLGLDGRIGTSFLFPGVGYGGSCFPKDIKALIGLAREHDYPLKLIQAIEDVNELQKQVIVDKILTFYSSELPAQLEERLASDRETEKPAPMPANLGVEADYSQILALDPSKMPDMTIQGGNQLLRSSSVSETSDSPVRGKTFAIWGLSFKPRTDDIREAPSRTIIARLLDLGAEIRAYDPAAAENARAVFGNRITCMPNNYEALEGVDALILVTEWNVFRNPDFAKMKSLMKFPVIFDGRNQYDPQEMRQLGFLYFAIGRR